MAETVLTAPDKEVVETIISETEDNVQYFLSISDKLVQEYARDFDILMQDLQKDVVENDPEDMLLEKYLLELNNKLYFLGSKVESVGIRDDLSKLAAKEVFNDTYLSSREKDSERKNKLTVAELTALAEGASKYETVMNNIYGRVYSQLKMKMTAGYDMVNSLRKIISRRMQEQALSATYKPVMPNMSEGEF